MRLLISYVFGRASNLFMDCTAGHEDRWAIRTMYEALLDYRFPVNLEEELRRS